MAWRVELAHRALLDGEALYGELGARYSCSPLVIKSRRKPSCPGRAGDEPGEEARLLVGRRARRSADDELRIQDDLRRCPGFVFEPVGDGVDRGLGEACSVLVDRGEVDVRQV
jgi:hypothetical protein